MNVSDIALILFIGGTFITLICLFSDVKKLEKEVDMLNGRVEELEEK